MTGTSQDTAQDAPENDVDEDDSLVELAPAVPLRAIFRRFWPHTRDFRGRMVLSLLLTGAVPAISTASIYLYKVLVDDVLTPHDFRLFPMIAALYVAIQQGSAVGGSQAPVVNSRVRASMLSRPHLRAVDR